MLEKYCDIKYRDYLLDISRVEYTTGKFSYQGKSQDKDNIYFGGPYTDVGRVINDFIYLLDKELGEREKEEEILFCSIIYKGYELGIWLKEDLSYMAWIDNFDFASWGTWSMEELVEVIEAFRKKVDSGTGEDLIQNITDYKGHKLVVRKKKDSNKYIGTSTLLGGKWRGEDYRTEDIVKRHQTSVDRTIMEIEKRLEKTYDTVCEEWGNTCNNYVEYKNCKLTIKVIPQDKNRRAFYIGGYYLKDYLGKWHYFTIESIYYDKVVTRFQKFVDEYCTDWLIYHSEEYKGYTLVVSNERYKDNNFFGSCKIHKNSIFKYIGKSYEEIEEKFKARIDRVVKEKKRVQINPLTSKQEKIQKLEQLQARISAQLEELKKESFTLTHKGVTLECEQGKDDTWIFLGKIRNAPENIDVRPICGDTIEEIQRNFEEYVNWLEEKMYLYNQIIK